MYIYCFVILIKERKNRLPFGGELFYTISL